jgi:hypothetical protein
MDYRILRRTDGARTANGARAADRTRRNLDPGTVKNWARDQAKAYRRNTEEARPLGGYAAALTAYSAAVAALAAAAKLTRRPAPDRFGPWDLALIGIATHKLSRTLAKDAVTSPLRAAFTTYAHPSGHAELAEEVRFHSGTRHAVGELITCPFCLAQWTATGFVAGTVLAPTATRLATATMTAVALSDYLQLGYAYLQKKSDN